MKTYNITKWAALLLTVSGMVALPLTVQAAAGDNKIVTSSTIESDKNYLSNNNSNAALEVSGSSVVYTGTNINATGTADGNSSRAARGAYIYNQGAANITGGTLATTGTGTYAYALYVNGTSSFIGSGLTLVASATAISSYSVMAQNNSSVRLENSTIINDSHNGPGITMELSSTLVGNHLVIESTKTGAGIRVAAESWAQLDNLEIRVSGSISTNPSGYRFDTAFIAEGTNSVVTGSHWNLSLNLSGSNAIYGLGAVSWAVITVDDLVLNVSGTTPLIVGVQAGGGTINLEHATIGVMGDNSVGLRTERGGAGNGTAGVINIQNSTVTVSGSGARGIDMGQRGSNNATLTNVDVKVSGENSVGALLQMGHDSTGTSSNHLTIDGGSLISEGAGILVGQNGAVNDSGVYENQSTSYEVNISNGAVITSGSGKDAIAINNVVTGTDGSQVEAGLNGSINIGNSTINGGISNNGSADAGINLDNSTIIGDITGSGSSITTLTLNNSVMTGISTINDNATTNLTIRNNANWNMTGKSKLTTLHGDNGSITIANVQGDDLTVSGVNGVSGISGQTALHLTLSDSVKNQTEIRVVVDETNAMSNSAFTLGSEVSNGMYDYVLENNADGAWLVYTAPVNPPVDPPVDPTDPTDPITPPVPNTPPVISSEGDAVLNTAAAVAGFWFTQLDNLHKRMGELRYNKPAGGDLINNVWVRAYGQQINANTGIYSVKGFAETQYGVDLGTDYLWKLDAANQLYTGVFAGYGGADRDFHTSYNGSTDSGYGGLYATWINTDGWYADAVAKGQYFRNEFSGADRGDYDSVGVGFSVELGRQFEFKDGWFAEPSVQFSYLHLMNDNYTTRDGMGVTLSDADVLHIYGGARFGRNIKLTNSGMLQPYIKAGGLGQISSGNKLTVSGDHWRPNLDGARAVIGAGLVWQLDANNQLHLDYEASFGEKYDKPWGVNFGYRYQF